MTAKAPIKTDSSGVAATSRDVPNPPASPSPLLDHVSPKVILMAPGQESLIEKAWQIVESTDRQQDAAALIELADMFRDGVTHPGRNAIIEFSPDVPAQIERRLREIAGRIHT